MLIPTILSSLYPFGYNYAVKLLLDVVTEQEKPSYGQLLAPVLLFIGTNLMAELIWRIGQVAAWKSIPYVRRSLCLEVYDYVQHHSYTYFQNNFTGAITSKIKGILSGYDKLWNEVHHGLGLTILKVLVNLIVLFFVNQQVGVFLFIWSVIFFLIMYRMSKKLDKLAFEESESSYKVIGQLSDKIMNVLSIFAFARQRFELQLLDDHITQDYIPKQVKLHKYDFNVQVVGGLLYIAKFCFILIYTIYLKIIGVISVGDLAFVLGLTLSLADEVWRAIMCFQSVLREVGELKSAFSTIYAPHTQLASGQSLPLVVRSPRIEFKGVTLAYNEKEYIFKDFNLTIQAGEKVGLVGRSGAGKSSLIHLLMRYFRRDSGEIYIDGKNIDNFTEESLRNQIALIPQDTMLFHRTLLDNIRYGKPEATQEEVIEAARRACIHDFIMSLPQQYQTYAGERGLKISGGQRQRVAIARAILKDAPILLLDEATSALDTQAEIFIQKSLHALVAEQQKTVMAIAHRLSTLKDMDRIVVLDKGAIVEQGTHESLLQDSTSMYHSLWRLQDQDIN